ncbi:Cyclic nucleotide-gated cation channel alpha-3 [Hypsibius exemplaris]|uniref:Cyclic nucleotide-gated cation channel alpha-3 n=1 Tax=Hypsibius exemplaris TaxID=2072580 RepID=A0A1W0WUP9_HYPEX|nr:Cyclic nucleotide-gated cation channel alpha-3 [Hypsibius exemplaris]
MMKADWWRRKCRPFPTSCGPIDPYGYSYFAWICVCLCACLYNWYSIPLRMAFEQVQSELWMIADYLCDMIYIMDIGVNFLISTPRLGLPEQDLEYSRQAYKKSWTFTLDVVSVLPTDVVFLIQRNAEGAIVGIRSNRLLKYHRISEWFDYVISHSSYPIVFRFARMLAYILMLIHVTSCTYYAMNVYIGFGSDNWTIPNLVGTTEGAFINLYVRCFHWATVILSDDGDNSQASLVIELAYRCMVTLQGHILVGSVIAIVASIFGTVNVKEGRFRHQLDGIKKYMQFRHVDPDMQDRVFKWASFMWEGKKFRDSERDLEILPVPLRRVIAQAAHMDTFQRVKLFDDCEPQFLEELIMRLELQVFSPGDLICRKGDVGREMYVTRTGTLQVVSDEGQVFASLGQGSVFGEISLLSSFTKQENRRTANIRSFSYSELFSLSSANFKEVLENFPLARRKMIAKSRELLKDRTTDMSEVVHNDAEDDDELAFKVEKLQELAQDIVLLIETFTKTIIEDTTKLKRRLAVLERRRHHPGHPSRKPKLILFAQTPV